MRRVLLTEEVNTQGLPAIILNYIIPIDQGLIMGERCTYLFYSYMTPSATL